MIGTLLMCKMISIIIPCYNSEKCLKDCIESVIAQKYTDFECLLVDDGSTDKTCEICSNYANMDRRIKYFKKENQGVSATRNYGIKKASGACCVFLDSDDTLSELFLDELIKQYNDETLPICGVTFVDNDKTYVKKFSAKIEETKDILSNFSDYREMVESDIIFNSIWNKMYNLELIKEKGLMFEESLSMAEDFLFNMQYLVNIKYINLLEPILYNHITNTTGICSQSDNRVIQYMNNEFYVLDKIKELLQEKDISEKELSKYKRELCIKYGVRIYRFVSNNDDVKSAVKFVGLKYSFADIFKERQIKNAVFLFILKMPILFNLLKSLRRKK